jgi:hypothetical protein
LLLGARRSDEHRLSPGLGPDEKKGKSLLHPLNYGGGLLNPSTMKRFILHLELFKTGQITLQAVLKRRIRYRNHVIATVTAGLLFSFYLFRPNF